MRSQPKLKNPPRPLFSCGIFGHCTQSVVLSPTNPNPPQLPPTSQAVRPPSAPPLEPGRHHPSSSSSSSSSTSQSFTQWKFPLPHHPPPHDSDPPPAATAAPEVEDDWSSRVLSSSLAEVLHAAEIQLSSGSEQSRLAGLHLLERSLVPDPLPDGSGGTRCPALVMEGVVGFLKQASAARAATKVLLALCLAEANRRAAVEAGAVVAIVETVLGMDVAAAERALAALELLCTVPEGAAELRAHALAVPALVEALGKMGGRGKECAISVLTAMFGGGGGGEGPPAAVAQAVMLALQGECSARGRRKGAQLLRAIQENGQLDMT